MTLLVATMLGLYNRNYHLIRQTNTFFLRNLNDDMYNWVIVKYGKPNSWTYSQFHSIADDVYTTFFEKCERELAEPEKAEAETAEPDRHITFLFNLDVPECSKKSDVQECSNMKEKEDQQDVHPGIVIVITSSSSELECSSTSELKCSSTLESTSFDDSTWSELSSYVSSYDESSSSDESGCLEKSEEIDEKDEQEDEIDEEAKDGKDDSHDELWSPKTIGTNTKNLISLKMKGASSNSTPSTKKLVKSSEPIRNCIIGLANNKTLEMIINKEFGVKKEEVKDQVKESKE
ncbi:hypothetical protein Tco_1028685 [Tanacetum coccineum]|uniref:Uncharacterized protein n=1 Tax=Tanacetum coccineum TaxID=301880 RepID=A0ABQ5G1A7_9ASTR